MLATISSRQWALKRSGSLNTEKDSPSLEPKDEPNASKAEPRTKCTEPELHRYSEANDQRNLNPSLHRPKLQSKQYKPEDFPQTPRLRLRSRFFLISLAVIKLRRSLGRKVMKLCRLRLNLKFGQIESRILWT